MTVDDKIDMVCFHDPQIGLGLHRGGCAKQRILEIRSQHRAAPSIGNSRPRALLHQVLIILIDPDMRTVHDLDNLPIDIPRHDTVLFPFIIQGLGCALGIKEFPIRLAPLIERLLGNFTGNLIQVTVHRLTIDLNGGGNI